MNPWPPEQYNMIAMNSGMVNMMHPPPGGMIQMIAEHHMMGGPEWTPNQAPKGPDNFIGPIPPEDQDTTMDLTQDESNDRNLSEGHAQDNRRPRSRQSGHQSNHKDRGNRNRDSKDSSRHDRSDRSRRPRSPDRNRDRSDRSRSSRENRERVSRFTPRDEPNISGMSPGVPSDNMMLSGMMTYGNSMIPGQQPAMDISNIPNILNMPHNIPNMMPGMNMMGNMMSGMMDQNMLMAQQQMQLMSSQPIFLQNGVLLTPIPGVALPQRRERPPGCRTIFVGGLPSVVGLDTITEIFQRFGNIEDIKYQRGVCRVRFTKQEMVEQSFILSGYRFKTHDQSDIEATSLFIDYALNSDDQADMERQKREPTPPRINPFTPMALTTLIDKIKSDAEFAESAPTLAYWLEKGECNKKNANMFYSLIQACNNQVRRLYNEKMGVEEEFLNLKTPMKEKFAHIIFQFDQVAKILSAAKHKRASDHFSKQQRRNIEMWLKMTEDLENIKEEFNMLFDDEDTDKIGQKLVLADKYEQLKVEYETLVCELEGYKNEAHLAKNEAVMKFEKFKAQYIAQQALQSGRPHQVFPPLPPPPPMPNIQTPLHLPPPTPDETKYVMSLGLKQEAKIIAMLTAFLLAHPLGATIDYLASYVRSMVPDITQQAVNNVLNKYEDIFLRQAKDRWIFRLFDIVKQEVQ